MIERNISLASTGSARTSGCDNQLRLGYSRNRGQRWKHREPPDTGSGWPTDALQRNTRCCLKR